MFRRVFPKPLACLALIGMIGLVGCEKEVILPGEREDIRATDVELTNESRSIRLAAQTANQTWTQGAGTPAYRTTHPALRSAPTLAWSASIGEGNSRRQRITAEPIVSGGLIYTLDAQATVTATATNGGRVWSTELTPARDSEKDATGGGMAIYNGRLYVSSGFGLLTTLDAKTGAILWQQKLDATGSGQPTVVDGLIYLVAGDNTGWAIKTDDGRIAWQISGTPSLSNVLGAPAPAVSGKYAVFAFGSGDLTAVFRRGGLRRWSGSVAGQRVGRSVSQVSDITGAPMIVGGTVYAGNHSGRLSSFDLESGDLNWVALEGALSNIWPGGDSLFVITDRLQLARISTADGQVVWAQDLPGFIKDKPRRRGPVYAHYGPVVAGGRVAVASGDGVLRFFKPEDGSLVHQVQIPDGAASAPVVAGQTLYVLSQKGQLHAFR